MNGTALSASASLSAWNNPMEQEPKESEETRAAADRHKRIILVVMGLFIAVPLLLATLRILGVL
jgi:hypothetical protein